MGALIINNQSNRYHLVRTFSTYVLNKYVLYDCTQYTPFYQYKNEVHSQYLLLLCFIYVGDAKCCGKISRFSASDTMRKFSQEGSKAMCGILLCHQHERVCL